MPYADVNELKLYYETSGEGPRLLYISGTGGDLRRTPSVFDSPLIDHFQILAYDQRGLGRTTALDKPCTMADYANDAAGLLDAVGWDSCLVMGVSFGGMVAQEFAIRHSQRVDRLVLACTSAGGQGGASYPIHELADVSPETYAQVMMELADVRHDRAWQEANRSEAQAIFEMMVSGRRASAADSERNRGFVRQLEARKDHNVYDRLPTLSMPVYICGGRYDGLAPVANLEAIHAQIPGARLDLFEGGHGFLMQDPTAYPSVINFLHQ